MKDRVPESPFEVELKERLSAIKNASERQTFIELTRELLRLPLEQTAAALETSASIAAVSLRASLEFLRAAPEAAQVLGASELRAWGEMGRRLSMSDIETAISFFIAGVSHLKEFPKEVQQPLFQLCARQMTLSGPIGIDTLQKAETLAKAISDRETLLSVLEIASEISRRSAKHSADFLAASPNVIASLNRVRDPSLTQRALDLASGFASRAGGMASDAWTAIPEALGGLRVRDSIKLIDRTHDFLERGGGGALHVMLSGSEILRTLPEIFDDWIDLLWIVAQHGNASLVAFVRSTPRFVRGLLVEVDSRRAVDLSRRVLALMQDIARIDGEAALACFRASPAMLRTVSIEQFSEWALQGLAIAAGDSRARRSYFALETRGSYEALHSGSSKGLALDSVQHLLRLYVEALTGREIEIAPIAAVPVESRIGDGRTIHLPSLVSEFRDDELDFRLYKVLAAHAAGQIEFGTYESGTAIVAAAHSSIREKYDPQYADERDSFSLGGYLMDSIDQQVTAQAGAPVDYRAVLKLFPHRQLARRIFGTLENGRIDFRLRKRYRGLARDLDLVRTHLRRGRPRITDLPAGLIPFELLFQITLLGGALEDSRQYYAQVVSELETIVAEYLSAPDASVADTLMATSRVYSLFQSVAPADDPLQQVEAQEEPSESDNESAAISETLKTRPAVREPQRRDARELFNAWNDPDVEGEPDDLDGAEAWMEAENPEQKLEEGEVAYNYDEWDRELTDHRLGWCRVVEKRVKHGDRAFVDHTRDRHRGVISSIRYQFQLMKPEELTRVANELDGEDYDLNAVVDYVIDRRAAKVGGGHQSERLYTKRLRRTRDVAVSFLLDQSSSTARTIGRHPLQPYTHPGRRIIEIEKEGLVLMSEALEAVGDRYSINGFTSEGRRNVKYYIVKDFHEQYSDEVKRRIGGITYQNNTRLGAAIRHASAKLARQQARTRLLIVLSDGRPYDHDYGDARYAREDTREALRQAKVQGITPFCITIDRESEAELRDLYGEIGYTIIDDVLSLPERLPGIYRRLTT